MTTEQKLKHSVGLVLALREYDCFYKDSVRGWIKISPMAYLYWRRNYRGSNYSCRIARVKVRGAK